MGGNVTFAPSTLGGTGTAVIQSTGSLAQAGTVDLGAATRTFTINDGAPAVDVSILAAIIGSGGLTKAGAGTLQLSGADTYTGGTTVTDGMLTLSGAAAKLGTGDVTMQASAAGSVLQIQSGVSNAIANTANLSLFDSSSPASGLSEGLAAAPGRQSHLRRPGHRDQRDGEHAAAQRRGPRPRHVRQLDQQRHV